MFLSNIQNNFLGNGNGLTSSLDSKEAKCTMFFAAHTVAREEHEFDVTYSKQGVFKVDFLTISLQKGSSGICDKIKGKI